MPMEQREDVVIVGAGVIGLASALALLESGRSVRVIDAGRVGGGSSHGNCGTITPSHAPPLAAPGVVLRALRWMLTPDAPLYVAPRFDPALWSWLLRFAVRCNDRDWRSSARAKSAILNDSRDRLADWVRHYELACEFAHSGEDYVFRDPHEFEHFQDEVGFLRELGVRVDVVDGRTYELMEPALKPGVAGAIRFDGDAVLRPDRYVGELARVVRARGGTIVEQCAFTGMRKDGAGVRVSTAQGEIAAREMVMALGAWSPKLADAIGAPALKGAIQPGKGYSIT